MFFSNISLAFAGRRPEIPSNALPPLLLVLVPLKTNQQQASGRFQLSTSPLTIYPVGQCRSVEIAFL